LSRRTSCPTSSRHTGEQLVALLYGHVAVLDDGVEQYLDVDLVVGAVDAGRVVDGVHVYATPVEGVLDPPPLREPEVPSLTDHSAPELVSVGPHGVAGPVANFGVGLPARLHVGTDAPVPQQVYPRLEQGVYNLVGCQGFILDVEQLAYLRGEGDGLRRAREDAAAL